MEMPESTASALLGKAQKLATTNAGFAQFLRAAVLAMDGEDLARQDAECFEANLLRSYEHLHSYSGDKSQLVVTEPQQPGEPLILDLISPDMPFIVDSTLAALRATGGSVRLFTHPIVRLKNGDTFEAPEQTISVLHIHSDLVTDTKVLVQEIESTLVDVTRVANDWQQMLNRLGRAIDQPPANAAPQTDEPLRFLKWLLEDNFTFLGMRDYHLVDDKLVPLVETSLGILRDAEMKVLRSGADYVESTPQHSDFIASSDALLITKANVRARVHRRQHMDYIGIKIVDTMGKVAGELRIVGLFTAQALAMPHADVPIIQRKIAEVIQQSDTDPHTHDGRALRSALNSYPRDELFQIDTDQLLEFAAAIAGLYHRPRIRVLPRIDRFGNFVSILVYVPRDRYDGEARARITRFLAQAYDGRVSAFYPHFPEGEMVRLHVIIGRTGGVTPQPTRASLEERITVLTANFGDMLMATAKDPAVVSDYRSAFSAAYQSHNSIADAHDDIAVLKGLSEKRDVAIKLRNRSGTEGVLGLKFYHRADAIPLSERVPMLEAFGFRVIDERTYTVVPRDGVSHYIHDMVLEPVDGTHFNLETRSQAVEEGLLAVWNGAAESDQINILVSQTELSWTDAALLRALSRYLRQIGISYSQRYIARVLVKQAEASSALIALFDALHNPVQPDRDAKAETARRRITIALDTMPSLDEDRIIRRFLNLIDSALRTNAYQRDTEGRRMPTLAIKFDSAQIEGMAAPRPYREISVYSPRVEGVHLRFGAIARGGLRWSDRPEDFRTEVLGLVKAQQVKNAVIVPVGAKGGFVPKLLESGMARETWAAEGLAAYKIFIGALLDITDNLINGAVVPPHDVVRRDGDDPYLVVAADKGTASFSDSANAIAVARGFWLGDAFASGGSTGYDHKKMGITARGGWETVKRHFREMNRDIQRDPFTAVGVGDMSGDVFGNGMLLSQATRLVAAFDHRDIFIDPNPDPATSFDERRRLFTLPRSSWQDYDRSLISAGGGVFSRSLKRLPLTPEMQTLLDLAKDYATPTEVITAILKAEVDLLWFGGIGTYIRATSETDAGAGDRANDAIRITGRDVRARVIGEGANLGVTQCGRIEYALAGGRINTDAIDNSAGVNSSDLEVNIKIAVAPLVADGTLNMTSRNRLLANMTEEVSALCLHNNYRQSLALSLAHRANIDELPDHKELINWLTRRGLLDRAVEFLPSNKIMDNRAASRQGLTRPELAVLLAYAKLTLYNDLLASRAIDNDYLVRELYHYFPAALREAYVDAIANHQLKREIIATVLANAMINRGGPAFVSELVAATSVTPGEVAMAYAITRDVYALSPLNNAIDMLDGKIDGAVQLDLYAEIQHLLRQETLWFLRNTDVTEDVVNLVNRHSTGVAALKICLMTTLPSSLIDAITARTVELALKGVPEGTAQHIAQLPVLTYASDVVMVSERAGVSVADAATAFFGVFTTFNLWSLIEQGRTIYLDDRFDRMALDRALANLMRAHRDLTADVLKTGTGIITERLDSWHIHQKAAIKRITTAITDLTQGSLTVSRLSVAAGLLADLTQET